MFTGLVEKTSTVHQIYKKDGITHLEIEAPENFSTSIGDSVAVNGCCLTVAQEPTDILVFHVNAETARLTNISSLKQGQTINLERALQLGDRLGGHLVSGHIDQLGTLEKIDRHPEGWNITVSLPNSLKPLIIPKGSICLDGISLTINRITDDTSGSTIELMLIPTTINDTHFHKISEGWKLNVEVDIMGKYMQRFQQTGFTSPQET